MACVGSVVAIAAAWTLGAPAADIHNGLLGYNAVLVAMALGGVFVVLTRWSFGYAVAGAVVSTCLTATMTAFFSPFGGHTLTWPFVLTTLVFVAAIPSFPGLRRT
ncbi:hypothetical protein GCM10027521_45090 [Amycolatopsis cihanbeyliensis]